MRLLMMFSTIRKGGVVPFRVLVRLDEILLVQLWYGQLTPWIIHFFLTVDGTTVHVTGSKLAKAKI